MEEKICPVNHGNVQKSHATKKANPIQKPEIAVAMIKRAQRPLLIVGSNATERWMEGKQANRIPD